MEPSPFHQNDYREGDLETKVGLLILLLDAVGKAALLLGSFLSPQLTLSVLDFSPGREESGLISSSLLLGSLGEKSFQQLVTARKGRPWWFALVQGFGLDYFSSSSRIVCLDPS